MAAASITENDILKSLIRKGALTELCKELNTQILTSPRQNDSQTELKPAGVMSADKLKEQLQRDQLRLIAKIWTAMNKLIRSQCNKGRIVDSLYFGSFGKSSVMRQDA